MTIRKFEVPSTEREFLASFGVNLGFFQAHGKVARCYFLSSNAKLLYFNLGLYTHPRSRECFPDQETLKSELGWAGQKLTAAIKELKEKGLVDTRRLAGKPLRYVLKELCKVPALTHSEIVHTTRKGLRVRPKEFGEALKLYKKSELCEAISDHSDPALFQLDIGEWFASYFGKVLQDGDIVKSSSTTYASLPAPTPSDSLPREVRVDNQVTRETNPEGKSNKAIKVLDPDAVPVAKWNVNHFASYFRRLYKERYNTDSPGTLEEQKKLGVLIRSGREKEIIKRDMDNFFRLDYFETKTIRLFTSSNSQAILDEHSRSGKLPTFRKSDGKPRLGAAVGDKEDPFDVYDRLQEEKTRLKAGVSEEVKTLESGKD